MFYKFAAQINTRHFVKKKPRYVNLIKRLQSKYRFIVLNDTTFAEINQIRLSKLHIFSLISLLVIISSIVSILLVIHTPLKIFLPAYEDESVRQQSLNNIQLIDSLENKLHNYDLYINNIKTIISGGMPNNHENTQDTSYDYENINFEKSVHDSLLRVQVEEEEMYNLTLPETEEIEQNNISNIHFIAPINKGFITNKYSLETGHLGVDVVASPNQGVLATLEGTVIIATWTYDTGYIIMIQHENNIISAYKHNSVLLKDVGDHVKSGETIAIIGNSGELTTGPHLHFELWHNGTALNPENYIVF